MVRAEGGGGGSLGSDKHGKDTVRVRKGPS